MNKFQQYIAFEKKDDAERMVYGYASTEATDSQGEIVKVDAIKSALPEYMKYGNVREMHQPSAVGKTHEATVDDKGLYIGVKVVDDAAWQKVQEGVYNGFSIGGKVVTKLDNVIESVSLTEISLVDRPANPEAIFDVVKCEDGKTLLDIAKATTEHPVGEDTNPQAIIHHEVKTEEEIEADKAKAAEEAAAEEVDEKPAKKEKKGEEAAPEEKPEKKEAAAGAEMKKQMWTADTLVDLACDLSWVIRDMKVRGDDTAEMEVALQNIKAAAVKELEKDEVWPTDMVDVFAYASKIVDLKKNDGAEPETPATEEPQNISKFVMPTEDEIKAELTKNGIEVTPENIGVMKDIAANNIVKALLEDQQKGLQHDFEVDTMKAALGPVFEQVKAQLEKFNNSKPLPFQYMKLTKVAEPETEEKPAAELAKTEAAPTLTKNQEPEALVKAEDMQKLENRLAKEITDLKEQFEKLAGTERPMTLKAGYLVKRFEEPDADKEAEKAKIEKAMEELRPKLVADPANAELRKMSDELTTKWQQLSRTN